MLQETRASGIFPDENVRKVGRRPAPLGLKVAAALRYMALGVPVNGLTEGSEVSREALDVFFFGIDRQLGDKQKEICWFRWFCHRFEVE